MSTPAISPVKIPEDVTVPTDGFSVAQMPPWNVSAMGAEILEQIVVIPVKGLKTGMVSTLIVVVVKQPLFTDVAVKVMEPYLSATTRTGVVEVGRMPTIVESEEVQLNPRLVLLKTDQ